MNFRKGLKKVTWAVSLSAFAGWALIGALDAVAQNNSEGLVAGPLCGTVSFITIWCVYAMILYAASLPKDFVPKDFVPEAVGKEEEKAPIAT